MRLALIGALGLLEDSAAQAVVAQDASQQQQAFAEDLPGSEPVDEQGAWGSITADTVATLSVADEDFAGSLPLSEDAAPQASAPETLLPFVQFAPEDFAGSLPLEEDGSRGAVSDASWCGAAAAAPEDIASTVVVATGLEEDGAKALLPEAPVFLVSTSPEDFAGSVPLDEASALAAPGTDATFISGTSGTSGVEEFGGAHPTEDSSMSPAPSTLDAFTFSASEDFAGSLPLDESGVATASMPLDAGCASVVWLEDFAGAHPTEDGAVGAALIVETTTSQATPAEEFAGALTVDESGISSTSVALPAPQQQLASLDEEYIEASALIEDSSNVPAAAYAHDATQDGAWDEGGFQTPSPPPAVFYLVPPAPVPPKTPTVPMAVGFDMNPVTPLVAVAAMAPGVVSTDTQQHVVVTAPDDVVYVYAALQRRIVTDGAKVSLGTTLGFRLNSKSPTVVEVIRKTPPAAKPTGTAAVPVAAVPPKSPAAPPPAPPPPAPQAKALAPLAAAVAATALALWAHGKGSAKEPAWKRLKPRYPDYRRGRKR